MNDAVYPLTIVSVLAIVVFGGLLIFGDIKSTELSDEIKIKPLEKTSCEIMYNIKSNFNSVDFHFYDKQRVIEQAESKWKIMNCDDPESEYWRGDSWKWSDSVENKIKGFGS